MHFEKQIFDHAYHGRTYMAMSLTAKSVPYKHGFAPFNSEVYRAPFPYLYSQTDRKLALICSPAFATRRSFQADRGKPNRSGSGGRSYHSVTGEGMSVPPAFMRMLEQYCKENGLYA